jgi:hypothetical protein
MLRTDETPVEPPCVGEVAARLANEAGQNGGQPLGGNAGLDIGQSQSGR